MSARRLRLLTARRTLFTRTAFLYIARKGSIAFLFSPISTMRSVRFLSTFGGISHPFMSQRFSQSGNWKKSSVLTSSTRGGSSESIRIASLAPFASEAATTASIRAFAFRTASAYACASSAPPPDDPAVSTRRLMREIKMLDLIILLSTCACLVPSPFLRGHYQRHELEILAF